MKKLSILITGLFIASTIFTSCTKDDAETTPSNPIGTATVKGYVYLMYDATTDTNGDLDVAADKQFAPEGTKLMLKIDANDLVQDPSNGVNYPDKEYYATVDANGMYSFTVDAGAKVVNSTMLKGVDLELDFTQDIYSGNPVVKHDTTITKHWTSNNPAVSFVQKDVVYQNLTYNGTSIY